MSFLKRAIGFAVLAAVFLFFVLAWKVYSFSQQPLNIETDRVYEINAGDSLYGMVNDLSKQNIIDCKKCAQWYLRFSSKPDIVPGEYKLTQGMHFSDLLKQLEKQTVLQYKVTFVEGWTIKQAINALWKKEKLKRLLKSNDAADLFKELDFLNDYKQYRNAEGLFFPATYSFNKGMTDIDILRQAHEKMKSVLEDEWSNKAGNLPYKSAYEALIMASIVEKETGLASEREQIAGVFVRRLAIGMPLQTDPTVIYGMGDSYDGNIRRRDLRAKTAYNTYVINGMPPTPIALSGREAIRAALHPADGDSLYFVATGDGGHTFSRNLRDHNKAVRAYLKSMRSKK